MKKVVGHDDIGLPRVLKLDIGTNMVYKKEQKRDIGF